MKKGDKNKEILPGWLSTAMLIAAALGAISLLCLLVYGLTHTPV